MTSPGDKEKQENDPVVQVVDSLNNAIDDLDLADNELDQDLNEIKSNTDPGEDVAEEQPDEMDAPAVQTPPQTAPDPTVQPQSDDPQDQDDPNLIQQSANDSIPLDQNFQESQTHTRETTDASQTTNDDGTGNGRSENDQTTQRSINPTSVYQRPEENNN